MCHGQEMDFTSIFVLGDDGSKVQATVLLSRVVMSSFICAMVKRWILHPYLYWGMILNPLCKDSNFWDGRLCTHMYVHTYIHIYIYVSLYIM